MNEVLAPMITSGQVRVAQRTAPPRVAWVDAARGLGMLLVILGHATPRSYPPLDAATTWIFSFHMPFFFFLSGLVFKEENFLLPWGLVAKRAARSLLLPYAIFGLVSFVFWLGTRHYAGDAMATLSPAAALAGLFYGGLYHPFTLTNPPLWFLPCLFCTTMLCRSLPRRPWPQRLTVLLLGAAAILYGTYAPDRLPWDLDIAGLALLFFYSGSLLRPWLLSVQALALRRWLLVIPAAFLVQTLGAFSNQPVSLASMQLGNPFLFLLSSSAGIAGCILLSPWLPERLFGDFLGRNTIIIFPLHLLCFSALSVVLALVSALKHAVYANAAITVAYYTIGTLVAFIAINPAVKIVLPWLIPAPKPLPAP